MKYYSIHGLPENQSQHDIDFEIKLLLDSLSSNSELNNESVLRLISLMKFISSSEILKPTNQFLRKHSFYEDFKALAGDIDERLFSLDAPYSVKTRTRARSICYSEYLKWRILKLNFGHLFSNGFPDLMLTFTSDSVGSSLSDSIELIMKENKRIILKDIREYDSPLKLKSLKEINQVLIEEKFIEGTDFYDDVIIDLKDLSANYDNTLLDSDDANTLIKKRKSETLKNHFIEYSIPDLPKVSKLTFDKYNELINLILDGKAEYRVAMLSFLGVFNHLNEYFDHNQEEVNKAVANWFRKNKTGREVRRHRNSIVKNDYNDKSDAYKFIVTVEKDYQRLI